MLYAVEAILKSQMVPGPATAAAVVASSVGFGSVSYWGQRLLLAVASQQSCPDCLCNRNCPAGAGPVQEVYVGTEDCSLVGVRVLAQEPLLVSFFGSVIFAVFLAGYCLGSRRSVPAEPFIPAPIFDVPSIRQAR